MDEQRTALAETIDEAEKLGMVIWLDEGDQAAADAAGDPLVWLVTCDTMAAGFGDLDNRTDVIGVFARLHDAVTAVLHRILVESAPTHPYGLHTFAPVFTQTPVRNWSR